MTEQASTDTTSTSTRTSAKATSTRELRCHWCRQPLGPRDRTWLTTTDPQGLACQDCTERRGAETRSVSGRATAMARLLDLAAADAAADSDDTPTGDAA